MRVRSLIVVLPAVLSLVVSQAASAARHQPPPRQPTPVKTQTVNPPIYWGAHIGDNYGLGSDAPWATAAMPDFASQMGKAPSLVEFGIWWSGSCAWAPCYSSGGAAFPTTQMQAIRSYGAIPVLDWASADASGSVTQPAFTDAAIASGVYDAYITQFAKDAKAWGHPFFLRYDWEMNGAWWPWSVGDNGNSAADYIAAWQHVHNIFVAQGANLVSWVWVVNVEPGSSTPFSTEYPGNSYVDWLGIDGYDHGSLGSPSGSFASIFQQTYNDLVSGATGKKIMLAEVGSTESANKPQFLSDSLSMIQGGTGIDAYVYMDKNDGTYSWRIDSSTAALNAFKAGIASSAFQPNIYGSLSTKP